jgi:CHAD domain-containing protein
MAKARAKQADSTAGEMLRATAARILTEANAALQRGELANSAAIHDFRKALKRWRALLRLLEPWLGAAGEKLRHEARDLARELNAPRDAQAALDALADAVKRAPDFSPALTPKIRASIEDLRRQAEGSALTAEIRTRIDGYLRRASRSAHRWQIKNVKSSDIAKSIKKTYRRARRRLPDDWGNASGDELHELRRRVIEYRYQMELAAPLWPRLAKSAIDEAQRLRDRLGRYQDLTVLAALTEPHRPLASWRSRLAPLIAERQALHLKHAARLGRRLFAARPKAFHRRLV